MTKPVDKVQIYKRESTAGGGDPSDNDDFYTESPLVPSEDAPEVQGVFFQDVEGGQPNDEDVYISRNGNDLIFRDKAVGAEVKLSDLSSGTGGSTDLGRLIFTVAGGMIYDKAGDIQLKRSE